MNEAPTPEGKAGTPPPHRAEPASEYDIVGFGALLRSRLFRTQNGLLPVLLGLVLIAAFFQSQNAQFLSAGNLVNLLVQGSVYMLIGMGQVYVLLLGEIDLSLGFVAGIAATVMTQLIQPMTGWPWWSAIIAALAVAALLGLFQGTLITRLRLPSFVVTLAGLLGFQGVMIHLLGEGGTIPIQDPTINKLANGTLSPTTGWIVMGVVLAVFALATLVRNVQRRKRGLAAASAATIFFRIGAAVAAGVLLVLICNVNRGLAIFPLRGMPWVIPIVFAVLLVSSFLLTRTRFGRYVHAIGGNAEAARRAGISLAGIRTAAFTIAAFIAGIGGIIYASRLNSISTSFEGGTIVLYVVATAVIGGTSLFGGRGHPLHAILGGVVIAAIVNGMALLGYSAAIQLMATALVLLAAITVDVVVRRRGDTAR